MFRRARCRAPLVNHRVFRDLVQKLLRCRAPGAATAPVPFAPPAAPLGSVVLADLVRNWGL